MNHKPHFHKGRFYNDQNDAIMRRFLNMLKSFLIIGKARLKKQIPVASVDVVQRWSVAPQIQDYQEGLCITWLGHATFLIQINGLNILTDPVCYEISRFAKRFIQAPLLPHQLPPIHAILISHNHPDHFDKKTLLALIKHQPHIYVPMGNKKWFAKRGFTTVHEMMWWDQVSGDVLGKQVSLSFLPASHWTSRGVLDINKSLWGSWMISCKGKSVYFAGDTAYAPHFQQIGEKFRTIDAALIPIGPNEPRNLMFDAHISSEEAVQAFLDLNARCFIPMHWGTFKFGIDSFNAPVDRLIAAWNYQKSWIHDKKLLLMKIGQSQLFDGVAGQDVIAYTSQQQLDGV